MIGNGSKNNPGLNSKLVHRIIPERIEKLIKGSSKLNPERIQEVIPELIQTCTKCWDETEYEHRFAYDAWYAKASFNLYGLQHRLSPGFVLDGGDQKCKLGCAQGWWASYGSTTFGSTDAS